MPKISMFIALALAALAGPALAQSGGDRFCKQYASSAADNAREAIRKNPSCQDPSKGMHANESMHFLWCMANPRSEVEGAFDNIRRLADQCTQRQAPPQGTFAPAPAPAASSRRPSGKWTPGNGRSCDDVCNRRGSNAVSSGEHVQNGRRTGDWFYVCAAEANGLRPGFNVQPHWANVCMVPFGGKELRISNYVCLCE